MKIPYTPFELRIALLNLDENKLDEKKMNEIKDELGSPPEDQKDLNKKIAEHHGISVEKLVDSPNYGILCQEYKEDILYQIVKKLVEKFDITEKEAWAIMVHSLGFL